MREYGKIVKEICREQRGKSAAAAISCLGKIFECYIDETIVGADMGIRYPGPSGEVKNVSVGVCQFLAIASNRQGMSRQEIFRLCEEWRDLSDKMEAGEENFETALREAVVFIDSRRSMLGLDQHMSKPKQYYESIYADREAMFLHSPFALEERLTKAVTKGDREAALQALEQITARGEKAVLAKDPLRSAKNSMIGSIAFLSRAAIQAGVGADNAFALSDALTQKVEEMDSRSGVLAFEEHILLTFIDLVQQHLKMVYSIPVTRAVHYIENRLNTKILLTDAATYAGVHGAYLSTCFKKETGMAFSEYVNARKIQESTYFVRHTSYSMSQIASLYGFCNQSYYITVFKKVMDMTPSEYRSRFLTG